MNKYVSLAIVVVFTNASVAELIGTFPDGGGKMTISPTGDPIQTGGLEFAAAPGILTQGVNAAPFAFFIPNRMAPGNVTFGTLGTRVTIDGPVELDMTVAADTTGADIAARWGRGQTPIPFPINGIIGELSQNGVMLGSYSTLGGPIKLEATLPVDVQSIELSATAGTLTGGGSAAPFEQVDTNTSTFWSASSLAPFTFEGSVVLDVEASADAKLDGNTSVGQEASPIFFSVTRPSFTRDLTGSYPFNGGPVTLRSNTPFATRGLELTAEQGVFSTGGSASPYESFVENTATRWAVESSTNVTIDGSVTLDLVTSPSSLITGVVRDERNTGFLFNVVGRSERTQLVGGISFDGGPITVRPNQAGSLVTLKGIRLTDSEGTLSGGGSAAPFETLSSNTASEWSVNSNAFVTIDGSVELDVTAGQSSRISGEQTDGVNAKPFEVLRALPQFSKALSGTFPSRGGPITIEPRNEPVVARQIDLTATQGTIVSGGSAAPFESLTNNVLSRWTAESSAGVTIDGRIELDAIASHDAQFDASYKDPITKFFSVRRDFTGVANSPLIGTFPLDGGKITLTTTQGPIQAGGIEFVAPEGDLTQGASPAPFAFFIPNSAAPGNVTFGSLGTPVTLDGSIELDVTARADATITATWGDGVTPRPFPVSNQPIVNVAATLVGTVPFDGGAISIEPLGNPVLSRELTIEATSGALAGGGSAAPYESIVSNTAQKWSVESSAEVTIDGPIELDVTASRAARLVGETTNGEASSEVVFAQASPEFTDKLYASYESIGGPISVVAPNGPVSTRSLDLAALSNSSLSAGGSATPYEQVVTNTDKRWTATSNTDVVLDGIVTLDVSASRGRGESRFVGHVTDGVATSQFAVLSRQPLSQLAATFPYDGGAVTLTGRGQQIRSLELNATNGSLVGGGDASPFSTLTANTSQQWSAESNVSVLIDGVIELDVMASADAQIAGVVSNEFENAEFAVRRRNPRISTSLVGEFDFEGGAISISSVDAPVSMQSLQLSSIAGGLVGGEVAAPFHTVVTNTRDQWIAESMASVLIDGTVELSVQAENASTIDGTYFDGAETLAFNVKRIGGFGGGLTAYYPPGGGRLVIIPNGDESLDLGGIEFVAEPGVLTQGASAGPFAFFIPNSAAPGNVALGVLGTPVTVDGAVELDIFVSADTPPGSITATWGKGTTPVSFTVLPLETVPEPSSNLLAAFALVGFLAMRGRKRAA